MSAERHRFNAGPEPNGLSESQMDFSLNYPLYPGSYLQPPMARAVNDPDGLSSLGAGHHNSPSILECPAPVLDETWRNVCYSESLDSSKRPLSQASSSMEFNQKPLEKRPRLDGSSFSATDSMLFKANLDGALASKINHHGNDLLGGISESFDFASTPDPPDDNSNLAQSISLIQETLDQSIAQAEDRAREQQQQQQQHQLQQAPQIHHIHRQSEPRQQQLQPQHQHLSPQHQHQIQSPPRQQHQIQSPPRQQHQIQSPPRQQHQIQSPPRQQIHVSPQQLMQPLQQRHQQIQQQQQQQRQQHHHLQQRQQEQVHQTHMSQRHQIQPPLHQQHQQRSQEHPQLQRQQQQSHHQHIHQRQQEQHLQQQEQHLQHQRQQLQQQCHSQHQQQTSQILARHQQLQPQLPLQPPPQQQNLAAPKQILAAPQRNLAAPQQNLTAPQQSPNACQRQPQLQRAHQQQVEIACLPQPAQLLGVQSTPIDRLESDIYQSSSTSTLPSGNVQAHSTPLTETTKPASLALSGSSFDSLTPTDNHKPVVMREYRLVFTEQVFERNGEVIRRQMIQQERSLGRSIQLSQGEFDSISRLLNLPLSTSGNLADISASQSQVPSSESIEPIAQPNEGRADQETAKKRPPSSLAELPDLPSVISSSDFSAETSAVTNEDMDAAVEKLSQVGDNPVLDQSTAKTTVKTESEEAPKAEEAKSPVRPDVQVPGPSSRSDGNIALPAPRLTSGTTCLAQWSDKLYYMAVVTKVYRNGRYGIKFADGTQESLKSDIIYPLKSDLDLGQQVYVKVKNMFEFAVIKEITTVNHRPGYVAELHTTKTVRVNRDKIVFTDEMITALKERKRNSPNLQNSVAIPNNDNNVFKSPRTESRAESLEPPPPAVKARKGRAQAATTSDSADSGAVEVSERGSRSSGPFSRRSVRSNMSVVASESGGVSGSSLNPPTLVFEGMGFLLTDTERPAGVVGSSDSSYDSSSLSGEQIEFNKEQLQSVIEENGGVVFRSFTEAECANSLDTGIQERYLLSRIHMKTLKYVLCLAAGIRCLSHHIVPAALRDGKMPELAKYQLPAGLSILEQTPIEQPAVHKAIFKNMTIAVIGEEGQFVNTWSQVIIAAGGRIASKLPQRQSPQQKASSATNGTDGIIRYLVTTPECSSLILRSARALRVAPVSHEWVVQCIIHAKVLEPDAHEAFAYDHKKKN